MAHFRPESQRRNAHENQQGQQRKPDRKKHKYPMKMDGCDLRGFVPATTSMHEQTAAAVVAPSFNGMTSQPQDCVPPMGFTITHRYNSRAAPI